MSKNKLMLTTIFLLITFILAASITPGEGRPSPDYSKPNAEPALVHKTGADRLAHLYAGQRRCTETTEHILTDFSGTDITGTLTYPDGGLNDAEATLTITKGSVGSDEIQKFTLTSGSTSISGWWSARTTCGYTGVTITFPEPAPIGSDTKHPAPQPTIISMTACRQGRRFILKGITSTFEFTSTAPVRATPSGWGRFCKIKGRG